MSIPRPHLLVTSCRALFRESKPQSLIRKYGTVSSAPAQAATPPSGAFDRAVEATAPRNNWTKEEIKEIYDTPLMKLAFAAVSYICLSCIFNHIDIGSSGYCTPKVPQPHLDPNVHFNEHQNRRVQRRLLICKSPCFSNGPASLSVLCSFKNSN